jgi:hypothetical protein
MLALDFDHKEFDTFAARLPKRHADAMNAALRSESYRLKQAIQAYAKSNGAGSWTYAPVTKYLRKGRGYGPWVAKFNRYHVDRANLTAYAGFLGKLPDAKFAPISRSFCASAAKHATGFTMFISGHAQRRIAKKLLNPDSPLYSRFTNLNRAQKKWNSIHAAIPRAGWRRVKARPWAGPVFRQEKSRTIRNLQVLYLTKIGGGRYEKTWMTDWGNA